MSGSKPPFLKNNSYHVFSRGDRRERVFFRSGDFRRFLEKIEEYRTKYAVAVVAYCLLPNHFHLLLEQLSDLPLSKFMGVLLNSYARYAAVKYDLPAGHIFQGRFGASLIESDESLLQNSRYIHLNPVKERLLKIDFTYRKDRNLKMYKDLVKAAREFPWSSYGVYLGKISSPVKVAKDTIIRLEEGVKNYQKFVESKISDGDFRSLELL